MCRVHRTEYTRALRKASVARKAEVESTPEPIAELPDIPDVPDIPDAVDDIPPDDVPVVFDPRAFVDSYRNDMTLMPADERQEYFDANEASIEKLPAEFQEEIDAINRELLP